MSSFSIDNTASVAPVSIPNNMFNSETLNPMEDLTIDSNIEQLDGQGITRFFFKHKKLSRTGFFYQLGGKIHAPFGASNYQDSGNVSIELNISPGSKDYAVLSQFLNVLKNFLINNPDIRAQYLDLPADEDFTDIHFKMMIQKQLVHYPKQKKGEAAKNTNQYDPTLTANMEFGFTKGDLKPVSGADTRTKVPYFGLEDINRNPMKNVSVGSICDMVPKRSDLFFVVLKFNRITLKGGKFNIKAEFHNAIIAPRQSFDRPRYIPDNNTEQELLKWKESMKMEDRISGGETSANNIYEKDNDDLPAGDDEDVVITD